MGPTSSIRSFLRDRSRWTGEFRHEANVLLGRKGAVTGWLAANAGRGRRDQPQTSSRPNLGRPADHRLLFCERSLSPASKNGASDRPLLRVAASYGAPAYGWARVQCSNVKPGKDGFNLGRHCPKRRGHPSNWYVRCESVRSFRHIGTGYTGNAPPVTD